MCNNGFGGGNCCWIIILLIIIWCCCGNGNWGGCGNDCGNGQDYYDADYTVVDDDNK